MDTGFAAQSGIPKQLVVKEYSTNEEELRLEWERIKREWVRTGVISEEISNTPRPHSFHRRLRFSRSSLTVEFVCEARYVHS